MVYFIYGENSYARRQAVLNITADSPRVERINATEITAPSLRQLLSGQSLFAEAKTVIISDVFSSKDLIDTMADIIESMSDDTDLVIVESAPDKRRKLFKWLNQNAKCTECDPLSEPQAVGFVERYVQTEQGNISAATARKLVSRVGADQARLVNELDKLMLFNQTINDKSVEQLTDQSPQDSIFVLTDALTANDSQAALAVYSDLRSRQIHPLEIMGTLGWHLHSLVQVFVLQNLSQKEIASQTGLHPYVVQKLQPSVSKISVEQIKTMLDAVISAESSMKGASQTNADSLFKTLLLQLSQA